MSQPRYPVYVISKGRSTCCLTARLLRRQGVEFRLVVEPQEAALYAEKFGAGCLRVLPFSDLGLGSVPARNWVWEDARAAGEHRHWILDDNIRAFRRGHGDGRIRCPAEVALRVVEDFVDRYENVAVAGPNYSMFYINAVPPFSLNVHVYSCCLVRCDLPQRWRGRYNEDTDLCLQVLAAGWCTVLVNAFLIDKIATMTMRGGNTDQLYAGDGRLKMARSLERMWPGVVRTTRRFRRPQHRIAYDWRRFDTPLVRRADVDFSALPETDDYGLRLHLPEGVHIPRVTRPRDLATGGQKLNK